MEWIIITQQWPNNGRCWVLIIIDQKWTVACCDVLISRGKCYQYSTMPIKLSAGNKHKGQCESCWLSNRSSASTRATVKDYICRPEREPFSCLQDAAVKWPKSNNLSTTFYDTKSKWNSMKYPQLMNGKDCSKFFHSKFMRGQTSWRIFTILHDFLL